MNLDQLKKKAAALPYLPGVYIMKNVNDRVIYVGKAKKLKNRVSQYFQETASHSAKTRQMVSKIDHFDVIICSSEFEALVLECSLIKQHKPKYNILLKDDKGFPYLRIDPNEEYPRITVAPRMIKDGAEYYGPFGSRSATKQILETIKKTLLLPGCSKKFPRDIGKGSPCLNFHINRCRGWCQTNNQRADYLECIDQARSLLSGRYRSVSAKIKVKMLEAADAMNFELAAALRDKLKSVELLGVKQLVSTGTFTDTDVIGYGESGSKACFAVLHFKDGMLLDKDYEIFDLPDDAESAVSALVKQYYLSRGFAPKQVLMPIKIPDSSLFVQLLEQEYGRKTRFIVPQRGNNMHLIRLAQANASEEALRLTDHNVRLNKTLQILGTMLQIDALHRIESYDISNISGTDIVGSMVVFLDGKPHKREYRRFKIKELAHQDDYASMHQVLTRRFERLKNGDPGFADMPDLLLIDGGIGHAKIAETVLQETAFSVPVFGMVKDDRHRTRALVTAAGEEIRIDSKQSVFSLIGNIQEETHRFAVNYHRKLRSDRLHYSELDKIAGIGPKRKKDLLKAYQSIKGISQSSVQELERLLPKHVARNVYNHFLKQREEE